MAALVDKNAIMQVIGCLIHNPLLFSTIGIKGLVLEDFDTRFTRSIFTAIINLVEGGSETITIIDIDNYLQGYGGLYADFTKHNGIGFLQDCYDFANLENFQYYYKRVKKFTALRQLKNIGMGIGGVYPENIDDAVEEKKLLLAFDEMEVEDIFSYFENKLHKLKYDFTIINKTSKKGADNLMALVNELKERPELGRPLQGEIFNNVCRGARKGKFYLNSSGSGMGKTRMMIGDACYLAYPYRWSNEKKEWEKIEGGREKVLVLITELTSEEVQTIMLANVSGINEEKILYGMYTEEEEDRVREAITIMENYPNLYIESIADPSVIQIRSIIKRQVAMNKITCVFYDYIFSSLNLLGEFRDIRVREDVSLMLLSTALKDLAVEHNLFIQSGTQLSGDYENWKGIRNQTLIRSSKSIVDKVDLGVITMPVRQEDLNLLTPVLRELGMPSPTHVRDIYKLRRGRYKNVRIWSIVDLGTCRVEDLFMTDGNYSPIDIVLYKAVFHDEEEEHKQEDSYINALLENGEESEAKEKNKEKGWLSC